MPASREARFLAFFFAASLGLFAIGAVLGADTEHLWWYVATTLSAGICLVAGRWLTGPIHRRVWSAVYLVGALLVGATLLSGSGLPALVGLWQGPNGRIQLWFGNPNILAASLALFGHVFSQLRSKPRAWAGTAAALGAIVLTGSRAALLALILASLALLAVRGARSVRSGARRLVLALALVLLLLVLLAIAFPRNRNVLPQSASFDAPRWVRSAPEVTAERSNLGGPTGARGDVWHLVARGLPTSRHQQVLLLQTVGRSIPGRSYVASVYVRAAQPTRFVLSDNLSQRTCRATTSWTRCITPAGLGDGRHWVQFRLRTVHPADRVALDVWGAQLEYGNVPTRATRTTRLTRTLGRLNPVTWPASYGWNSRLRLVQDAWNLFLRRPLGGSGIGSFHSRLQAIDATYSTARHAQNLFLNLLVRSGLFGLAGWLTLVLGVLALHGRHWRRWLPMVVLLLVLNTMDSTFYTAGFFYLFWFSLGTSFRQDVDPGAGSPPSTGREL